MRRLTWLGSDLCDYNAPLLGEHFSEQSERRALRAALARGRRPLARGPALPLRLDRSAEDAGDGRRAAQSVPRPQRCWPIRAAPMWRRSAATGTSSTPPSVRRRPARRSAAAQAPRASMAKSASSTCRTAPISSARWRRCSAQKSRSFARMGVEDIFARPGYREFFRAIATDPNVRDLIHVSRLDVGRDARPRPISACGSATATISSCRAIDDGEIVALRPRPRASARVAPPCDRERVSTASISPSATSPTSATGRDTELRLYDYLAAVTLRGRSGRGHVTAFRRTKRFIKQTPASGTPSARARSFAASLRHR